MIGRTVSNRWQSAAGVSFGAHSPHHLAPPHCQRREVWDEHRLIRYDDIRSPATIIILGTEASVQPESYAFVLPHCLMCPIFFSQGRVLKCFLDFGPCAISIFANADPTKIEASLRNVH